MLRKVKNPKTVVRTIGLREVWFFGIQYIDKDNNPSWLRLEKKISSHDFAEKAPYEFKFVVKFYPENVADELIQSTTIRYFYLQVKNEIMSGKIYCPTETAVLLASYACVAKYDIYNPSTCPATLPVDRLIPDQGQYNLTEEEWYDRIISYYKDHDMSREDAMMKYLELAQDLEMYGVEMFSIKNKKGTSLILGVDALGLSIYEPDNLLDPKIGFPWSEISKLSFHDKKFVIKPADASAKEFYFLAEKSRINKRILALCTGNHELYMRRRKTDSIEVQQMKIQAKEEREAKEQERQRLREERLQRMEYEQKLHDLKVEMREKESSYNAMTAKVDEFQAKIAALEALLTQEREERNRLEATQANLAKLNEQLKEETAASAEERAKLVAQRDQIAREVELQKAALAAKEAEKAKTEAELEHLRQQKTAASNGQGDTGSQDDENEARELEVIPNLQRPEESRTTTVSTNVDLQTKLKNLKDDLSSARDQSRMRQIDLRHEHNVREGNDKYKTLRQIRQGNTKMRVDQFEAM
ncbi:unnamed protein product [Schistocephalus solidus]|uniref:Moesin/ezrin/radixin homolog 1 n=2 Tax=Schistocephalus solidus TaxID=70667 RepID=A0A183SY39_SCHSO|nr:unnamed protein product [Schistocephalus solidus]